MPTIQIDMEEILYISPEPQEVGVDGTISIERKNKNKTVLVYVVEVDGNKKGKIIKFDVKEMRGIIKFDENELLYKSSSPQPVSVNGTVSVARKNIGKMVKAYVVEVK
jgi:hypothetical protein